MPHVGMLHHKVSGNSFGSGTYVAVTMEVWGRRIGGMNPGQTMNMYLQCHLKKKGI